MKTVVATDLQIAGLVPMSSVDWPGKLVATVFAQGCPWRCFYCQNTAILDTRLPGVVEWSEVTDLLARRHGLLDGVVFTGGEASRQGAIVPAAEEVREAGYQIGLHTAGAYPARMHELLDRHLLDWVGFDLKAPESMYDAVVGLQGSYRRTSESLDALLASGIDYEVRMTVTPEIADAVPEVVADARRRGVRTFALQQARTMGTDDAFQALAHEWQADWDERFRQVAQTVVEAGHFEHVEVRAAD